MPKKIIKGKKMFAPKDKGRKFNPTSADTATGKIKSAAELGLKAETIGIAKKKKTHKGRKVLESREAKIVENPKQSLILKGNKTSQNVQALLKDLHLIRGNDVSKLFLRKSHDIYPFDDIGPLEQMASKQDCSLFAMGTHQKKRPDNLILGRTFAAHILDMFEFGVYNYQPILAFAAKAVNPKIKPLLVFQGEQFEFSEKHRQLKSFFVDFFRIGEYEEANIAEMQRVMVFTSVSDVRIEVRHYEMNRDKQINETDVKNKTLSFNEIGPHFDLSYRRHKLATADLYKTAHRVPKLVGAETKRNKKNIYTDEFGQVHGKVFIQHQDIQTIALRKTKTRDEDGKKISRVQQKQDKLEKKNAASNPKLAAADV